VLLFRMLSVTRMLSVAGCQHGYDFSSSRCYFVEAATVGRKGAVREQRQHDLPVLHLLLPPKAGSPVAGSFLSQQLSSCFNLVA
jgi:hypothetical protein